MKTMKMKTNFDLSIKRTTGILIIDCINTKFLTRNHPKPSILMEEHELSRYIKTENFSSLSSIYRLMPIYSYDSIITVRTQLQSFPKLFSDFSDLHSQLFRQISQTHGGIIKPIYVCNFSHQPASRMISFDPASSYLVSASAAPVTGSNLSLLSPMFRYNSHAELVPRCLRLMHFTWAHRDRT